MKYTFIILFKYVDFAYVYLTDKKVFTFGNITFGVFWSNTHQIQPLVFQTCLNFMTLYILINASLPNASLPTTSPFNSPIILY